MLSSNPFTIPVYYVLLHFMSFLCTLQMKYILEGTREHMKKQHLIFLVISFFLFTTSYSQESIKFSDDEFVTHIKYHYQPTKI